jgi:hypothetical protein
MLPKAETNSMSFAWPTRRLPGRPDRRQPSVFMAIHSIAVLSLSCLLGCGVAGSKGSEGPPAISPQSPNAVSLNPQNWYIYYSSGMPPNPAPDSAGAWSFEFPSAGTGGHVNYVQTPFTATSTPSTVTITFKVESDSPIYDVIDPTDIPPATVRLFFEQQNDNLTNANGRWWYDEIIYNLGSQDNQTLSVTVPLTSDQWTNVDGQQDPQAFAAALANIGWVGMTFGGQYFAGHGVALSNGSSKFILISYSVM